MKTIPKLFISVLASGFQTMSQGRHSFTAVQMTYWGHLKAFEDGHHLVLSSVAE